MQYEKGRVAMQAITTSFRAGEIDLRRWRRAASDAGVGWSEWIRLALLAYEERGSASVAPGALESSGDRALVADGFAQDDGPAAEF
jgi:hypothetical protein